MICLKVCRSDAARGHPQSWLGDNGVITRHRFAISAESGARGIDLWSIV